MNLEELQKQILELPISDRWRLVHWVLNSIQQETLLSTPPSLTPNPITELHPWIQSLIGVIQPSAEDSTESYVDYLEEKYS